MSANAFPWHVKCSAEFKLANFRHNLALFERLVTPSVLPRMPTPASTRTGIECLRKPLSFIIALSWLAVAFVLIPHGFGTGWHLVMELTGFLLLIMAALGRLWAYAFIGGRKNQELCQDGPYSLCRNPLYFFSFLGVAGAGLALQNLVLFVVGVVGFLTYYHFVIRAEERRLAEIFGAAFTDYCQNVPRFWPRLHHLVMPESVTLPSKLFTRTLSEVFWFLAVIVIIEVIAIGKVGAWWPTIQTGLW